MGDQFRGEAMPAGVGLRIGRGIGAGIDTGIGIGAGMGAGIGSGIGIRLGIGGCPGAGFIRCRRHRRGGEIRSDGIWHGV
ncbi:hypothetical protein OJJOAM_001563 [Cupriavidus sp. H18C1]